MPSNVNEAYCRLLLLLRRFPRAVVTDIHLLDDKIIITLSMHIDGHAPFQRMALDTLLLRYRPGPPMSVPTTENEETLASREEWDQLAALIPDWDLIEDGFSEV